MKFQKAIPPPLLFLVLQQRFRFRCPISYSPLTTRRQWEQVLLRVPAQVLQCLKMHCNREEQQLPSAGKLGYIGTGKATSLEPHTFIKSGDMQEKHLYMYRYMLHCFNIKYMFANRCLKDTALVVFTHRKFSFDLLYAKGFSHASSSYCLGHFYSISVIGRMFCLIKSQDNFSQHAEL